MKAVVEHLEVEEGDNPDVISLVNMVLVDKRRYESTASDEFTAGIVAADIHHYSIRQALAAAGIHDSVFMMQPNVKSLRGNSFRKGYLFQLQGDLNTDDGSLRDLLIYRTRAHHPHAVGNYVAVQFV